MSSMGVPGLSVSGGRDVGVDMWPSITDGLAGLTGQVGGVSGLGDAGGDG